jgi:hypothetical protein
MEIEEPKPMESVELNEFSHEPWKPSLPLIQAVGGNILAHENYLPNSLVE